VSLDDTFAHRSLLVFGRSLQKCVPLDTSRRGFSLLQGSTPWQARSHGRASSQRIGYIWFAVLPANKICLKALKEAAYNVALPVFAVAQLLLTAGPPAMQQSIDVYWLPGP